MRADLVIRRHWQLVCCAFCFCWYQHSQALWTVQQPLQSWNPINLLQSQPLPHRLRKRRKKTADGQRRDGHC